MVIDRRKLGALLVAEVIEASQLSDLIHLAFPEGSGTGEPAPPGDYVYQHLFAEPFDFPTGYFCPFKTSFRWTASAIETPATSAM